MQQKPSREVNSHLAIQEIPYLLRNPKKHYSVHKSLPMVHTLSKTNPFHTVQTYIP